MSGVNHQLVDFRKTDEARLGAMLERAFDDDPCWRYLLVGEQKPRPEKELLWIWRCFARFAWKYGRTETTPEVAGAAVWIVPGGPPMGFWQMFRVGLMSFPLKFGWKRFSLFSKCVACSDEVHHRCMPGPHWYLFHLAVEPSEQGRGLGSALLRSTIDRADAAGVPCYLESTTDRARDLYLRHGFSVNENLADRLPAGAPPWYSMSRPGRAKP